MNRLFKYISLFIIGLSLYGQGHAQEVKTTNFYDQIKNYDLSTILMVDSILDKDREGNQAMIKRSEILGFIGDNYQRFYIHFISIIQNPVNPYEYFAYGKTKVKENICAFQGTIKIIRSEIYKNPDVPTCKQGTAICEVYLYEDKKMPFSGFFKGTLSSHFIIDYNGKFRYDALMFIADDFSNNQFVGNWTSYKTNASKKCHWGDYRIPDCGDLDSGAGEFYVNEKYIKNGWENFIFLLGGYKTDSQEFKNAVQKENEKWWK